MSEVELQLSTKELEARENELIPFSMGWNIPTRRMAGTEPPTQSRHMFAGSGRSRKSCFRFIDS